MDHRRRQLLRSATALGLACSGGVFASRVSFAGADTGQRRFVFVLLRGALDGLAAVPPVGDPDYARLRGELDLSKTAQLHRLDSLFALHPRSISWRICGSRSSWPLYTPWRRPTATARTSMGRMCWKAAPCGRMTRSPAG